MTETYDPKAKKSLTEIENQSGLIKLESRVKYVGSSPCFVNRNGTVKKIKREWVSARTLSRAGYGKEEPGYSITLHVLWDGPAPHGPQSCCLNEVELTPI